MADSKPEKKRPKAVKCKATNRFGRRCGAIANETGYCGIHSGRVDPRELGRRGGSKSPGSKALRRAADDELREQARDVLARAMRGEDVPKPVLESAKVLFSFRADQPPRASASEDVSSGFVRHDPLNGTTRLAGEPLRYSHILRPETDA